MVGVIRSRPVKVGRSRLLSCGNCNHRWGTVEMTAAFIREKILRSDDEALRALDRIVG
jgi:transcriptional regulator NrdR family protein